MGISLFSGKPRAPPNWSNKGPAPSQTETAPKGSVGQTKDSGSGRQPPNWNGNGQGGPSSGGSGRQPPNWGSNDQGGASSDTGGVPVGGFDPMSGMGMAAFAGDGSSPTDMFSDMMEMQRKMMFDPRLVCCLSLSRNLAQNGPFPQGFNTQIVKNTNKV